MSANDIVLYFSIFIVICVVVWAFIMINEFDKASKG